MTVQYVSSAPKRSVLELLALSFGLDDLDRLVDARGVRCPGLASNWWDYCRQLYSMNDILTDMRRIGDASRSAADILVLARRAASLRRGLSPDQSDALNRYLAHVPSRWQRLLHLLRTIPPAAVGARALEPFLLKQAPRFLPGTRISAFGNLEVLTFRGGGGFGEVYEARNTNVPRPFSVALKCAFDPFAVRLLRHEVSVLSVIRERGGNPGIVQNGLTSFEQDIGFATFEWVEGETLQEVLELHRWAGRVPSVDLVLRILAHVAKILELLHRYLYVHRDIKPANIMFSGRGKTKRVFLIDFGISGPVHDYVAPDWQIGDYTRRVINKALVSGGSYFYASPQQLDGDLSGPSDDVYSAAVTAIHSLTGIMDHRVNDVLFHWQDMLRDRWVSERFISLLEQCVHQDPRRRPPDGGELHSQLTDIILV
jgi:hypothetical protein